MESEVNLQRDIFSQEYLLEDSNTGEVVRNTGAVTKNFKKKDDFVKFFIEGVDFINSANISGNEIKFLINCLKWVNYKNILIMDSRMRKAIAQGMNVSLPAVSVCLKKLIDKEVLVHLDPSKLNPEVKAEFNLLDDDKKVYLINPNVIGKGSFRDLSKVKQVVVKEYDFEKLDYKKEVFNSFLYDGAEELIENKDKHQIDNIEILEHDSGKDVKVFVSERDKKEIDNKESSLQAKQPSLLEYADEEKKGNDSSFVEDIEKFKELLKIERQISDKKSKEMAQITEKILLKLASSGKLDEFRELSDLMKSIN